MAPEVTESRLRHLEPDGGEVDTGGDDLREIAEPERDVRRVALVRGGFREPQEAVDGRCGRFPPGEG